MVIRHSNIAHEKQNNKISHAMTLWWCNYHKNYTLFNNYAFIAVLISSHLMYYQNLQQSAKRISKMISRITRSKDERGSSNSQWHGVSDPVPVIPGREIKNAVLLQVVKQIKIETKKANEQGKAIRGIKLCVTKEFNIPWLNGNILDYYLMKADEWEKQQPMSVARE